MAFKIGFVFGVAASGFTLGCWLAVQAARQAALAVSRHG